VQQGPDTAVVGPSGAGKSSFIRLIIDWTNRLAERFTLAGQDYKELASRELRAGGHVMQSAYLFGHRSGESVLRAAQHGEERLLRR